MKNDYCLISDAWKWMEPYFVAQDVASDTIDALKEQFYNKTKKANKRLRRSVYGHGDFYITECNGMPFVIILSTEGTSEYWDELKKHLCVKGNEGRTVMFNFMYRNGDSRKAYFTSVVSDDLSDLSELKQCVYEKSMWRFELEIARFFKDKRELLEGSVLSKADIECLCCDWYVFV